LVELERRSPSFAKLEAGARLKYAISAAPSFAFLMPGGNKVAIRSDEDLKRVVEESLKINAKFVELEVLGAYKAGGAPPSASATPKATPASPPPAAAPRQTATAAPPSSGGVLTFAIPAAGGADKVKIAPQQDSDCYRFVPTPSREPTTIDVDIPTGRAVVFKITSASAKLTQTFNVPFDVTAKDLSLDGTTVVLKFPW